MRCIEISDAENTSVASGPININMRCIEIVVVILNSCVHYRLTLTWDVLKYVWPNSISYKSTRLTLTWDVLKSA